MDRPSALTAVARAWFGLTSREQQAIMLIAALAILGLLVRYWHQERSRPEANEPVVLEQTSSARE